MSQIASLFATLGFKVEDGNIKKFEKQLRDTAKQIRSTSTAVDRANNSTVKSTKAVKQAQNQLFKDIKSNYTKLRPTLDQVRRDLDKVRGAERNGKLNASESRELRRRIAGRYSTLRQQRQKERAAERKELDKTFEQTLATRQRQEKRLQDWLQSAEQRQRAERSEEAKKELSRRREMQAGIEKTKQSQIEKERQVRAQKELSERRDVEAWKQQSARRELSERRDLELWKARGQRAREEAARERRESAERLRRQRAEDRMSRGRKGIGYKGAREYGRAFIPGIGGAFAAIQSTRAYQNYQGMESGLTAAMGGPEQASQEITFLSQLADKLGLFVGELGKNYTNLAANTKGTSLEGAETRKIFEAVSSYSRVLNLSADDQSGVFRALYQMVGKGQIYAEELRGQMGERMPGAVQAMSRAAGFGDDEKGITAFFKAVEKGSVKATTVFPKFSEELMKMANQGGALEKAINNTSAAVGRFKTNVWLANKTFNESGFDQAVRDIFNQSSEAIKRAEPLWILMGKAAKYVGNVLEAPIELFGALAQKLPEIENFVSRNEGVFKALALALLACSAALRKLVFLVFVLPMGLNAIADLLLDFNRDRTWEEWAVQIGFAIAALSILAGLLKNVLGMGKSLKDVFPTGSGGASGAAGQTGKGALARFMTNPWTVAAGAMLYSPSVGEGSDFEGQARPSAFNARESYDMASDSNINAIISQMQSNQMATKTGAAPQQNIGSVEIILDSPDPNLAGEKVQEVFENMFNQQLRLSSGSELVTEK